MKKIHRTITTELLHYFLLSVVFLNFILIMEKVLKFSRLLSGIGASVSDVAAILLYLQPQIMILTIPMSLLLATLLTYGRLNTDNELTILKTAGMSFSAISLPVFLAGSACFILGLVMSFSAGPQGAQKVRETLSQIIIQRAPLTIESGIFNAVFKDVVILVRDKPAPEEMRGIFIYDSRIKHEPRIMMAREGKILTDSASNLSLYLKDGYMHITRSEGLTEIFFERYNLSLNFALEGSGKRNTEMTPGELLRETRERKDEGARTPLYLELHRRLSLPTLCLILSVLGPPLSLIFGKSGRLGGLTIGISIFTIYYALLVYGENIVRAGHVPHYVGAWFPTAIIGIAALFAFRRVISRS